MLTAKKNHFNIVGSEIFMNATFMRFFSIRFLLISIKNLGQNDIKTPVKVFQAKDLKQKGKLKRNKTCNHLVNCVQ